MHLEALLNVETPQAVGHLHLLWWWALDNVPSGNLSNITDEVVARASHWKGDCHTFVQALIESGFIDDSTKYLHDWNDYAGRLIAKREANTLRMREQRATHVQRTTIAHAGATVPNPTVPNPTVPNSTLPPYIPPAREPAPVKTEKTQDKPVTASEIPDTAPGMPVSGVENPQTKLNKTIISANFETFWKSYPKKMSKGDAEKAFLKINPDESLLAVMLAKIKEALDKGYWSLDNKKFIPHPATWLNRRGWEDEIPETGGNNNGRGDGTGGQKPIPASGRALPRREDYESPEEYRARYQREHAAPVETPPGGYSALPGV